MKENEKNICPTEKQLFLFVENKLDNQLHQDIANHISVCEICTDIVAGIQISQMDYPAYLMKQKIINQRIDKKATRKTPLLKRILPYAAVVAFFLTIAPISYIFMNKSDFSQDTAMSEPQKAKVVSDVEQSDFAEEASEDIVDQNINETKTGSVDNEKLKSNKKTNNPIRKQTRKQPVNNPPVTEEETISYNETETETNTKEATTEQITDTDQLGKKLEAEDDINVEPERLSETTTKSEKRTVVEEETEYVSETTQNLNALSGSANSRKKHQNSQRRNFFDKKNKVKLAEIVIKKRTSSDSTGYNNLTDSVSQLWKQANSKFELQQYDSCKIMLDRLEELNFDTLKINQLKQKISEKKQ